MKKILLIMTVLSVLALCTFTSSAYAIDAQFGFLPPNVNPEYGDQVDYLYKVIMTICVIIFVGTEGFLLFTIFAFRSKPGRKASYSHGSVKAEIFWSIMPGIILIWLAFYQRDTWDKAKMSMPSEDAVDMVIQAFPEQFQWNFRYAGKDGKFGTKDDIVTVNELHVVVNKKILIKMSAKDVIHSFYLPFARVKQDTVPGMLTKAWFSINRIRCWDLEKQEAVLLTEEEFRQKKIAIKGFRINEEKINSQGKVVDMKESLWPGFKRFSFVSTGRSKVAYVEGGKTVRNVPRAKAGDVTHALHTYEIACAELCGLGHYRMRGEMTVETEEMFQKWFETKVEEKEEDGPSRVERDRFNAIWDKFHKEYN